jgi:hypothetical protein
MPRRGDLHETRNDHQVATARQLASLGRATVVYDHQQLEAALCDLSRVSRPQQISSSASPQLLTALRSFVVGAPANEPVPQSEKAVAPMSSLDNRCDLTTASHRRKRTNTGKSEIGAVVLLAGGTGLNDLARAAERSVLELPVSQSETLLSLWRDQLEQTLVRPGVPAADVRIVGGALIRYEDRNCSDLLNIAHDHDPHELRGTGGILHDIAEDYPDESFLVVAGASTILLEPLNHLVAELMSARSDVAFFAHEDDTAPNLMLIRCNALRQVADVGFIDLKEQVLPVIASAGTVTVIRRQSPVAATMRTAQEYLRTLRLYHRLGNAKVTSFSSAFDEKWESTFSIIEAEAKLDGTASLHDSVVLASARVGRNATVIRSIVLPAAHVPAGATVVDQVVRPRSGAAIAAAVGAHR